MPPKYFDSSQEWWAEMFRLANADPATFKSDTCIACGGPVIKIQMIGGPHDGNYITVCDSTVAHAMCLLHKEAEKTLPKRSD